MPRPSPAQRECLETAAANKENGYVVVLRGRALNTGAALVRHGWAKRVDYWVGGGLRVYEITDEGRKALED